MLIKSFSLIQPKCKLGWNEDKLGLKAANTFNPMLLILQPNKITLLREITRPKAWHSFLIALKTRPWFGVTRQRRRPAPRGPGDRPDILREVVAIVPWSCNLESPGVRIASWSEPLTAQCLWLYSHSLFRDQEPLRLLPSGSEPSYRCCG